MTQKLSTVLLDYANALEKAVEQFQKAHEAAGGSYAQRHAMTLDNVFMICAARLYAVDEDKFEKANNIVDLCKYRKI